MRVVNEIKADVEVVHMGYTKKVEAEVQDRFRIERRTVGWQWGCWEKGWGGGEIQYIDLGFSGTGECSPGKKEVGGWEWKVVVVMAELFMDKAKVTIVRWFFTKK